jgi:hypothetical protein
MSSIGPWIPELEGGQLQPQLEAQSVDEHIGPWTSDPRGAATGRTPTPVRRLHPDELHAIDRKLRKNRQRAEARHTPYARKLKIEVEKLRAKLGRENRDPGACDPPPELSPAQTRERELAARMDSLEERERDQKRQAEALAGDADAQAFYRENFPTPAQNEARRIVRNELEAEAAADRARAERENGTVVRREHWDRERGRIEANAEAREGQANAQHADVVGSIRAERDRALADLGDRP